MLITILYEDSSNKGDIKGFGLHDLVCACVADALADDASTSLDAIKKKVEGHPCNSNTKVLAKCRQDLGLLSRPGPVIATVDSDKIHDLFNLSRGACKSQIRAAFCAGCEPMEMLDLVLIERNTETILSAVGRAMPEHQDLVDNALNKKRRALNDRDIVLKKAARGPRERRDRILGEVPSLERLRNRVVARLGSQDPQTP